MGRQLGGPAGDPRAGDRRIQPVGASAGSAYWKLLTALGIQQISQIHTNPPKNRAESTIGSSQLGSRTEGPAVTSIGNSFFILFHGEAGLM